MLQTSIQVRLYDTDAVGILYFGNQFRFAHEAFEQLLDKMGIAFKTFLDTSEVLFVIVHAESDYTHPLHVGDKLDIQVGISHMGHTSFEVSYFFYKDRLLVGKSKTVHVCLNRISHTKQPLPDDIRQKLFTHVL